MYQLMFFLRNIGEVCFRRRRAVFRVFMVSCLCAGLVLAFSPFREDPPVISAQTGATEAIHGIGGYSYPEKVVIELHDSENLSLGEGTLEPEAFSKPQMLLYTSYSIQKDDYIGKLAENFGLNEDTLISLNGIKNTRLIQIGQVLRIPNQDGIMYTIRNGDTLGEIAKKYEVDVSAIQIANELFSEKVLAGASLFIPGGRLDWVERQEINGDLFIWPATGYITSPYGYRNWPFGGGRQFHSGIDIGSPMGAPVKAAMSGRISAVGWDNTLGNYVVISHHSGYRTMYGHMSVIRVKSGAYVGTGERIGDIGSTGMSTGPHLHFTVYKNGVTVNPRALLK